MLRRSGCCSCFIIYTAIYQAVILNVTTSINASQSYKHTLYLYAVLTSESSRAASAMVAFNLKLRSLALPPLYKYKYKYKYKQVWLRFYRLFRAALQNYFQDKVVIIKLCMYIWCMYMSKRGGILIASTCSGNVCGAWSGLTTGYTCSSDFGLPYTVLIETGNAMPASKANLELIKQQKAIQSK